MSLEKTTPDPKAPQLPIDLKNPNGDEILMRLNPETDPDGLIRRLDMEKIPTTDNLSRVLGSIPEIASAIALSQSFSVVMPAGAVGKLMPLVKDPAMAGLYTTTIVGSNGQILGSAGLASMTGFVAPLVVWTVLAFLTGQFFLTQIQKNTRAIFDELRNILYFLVAKEENDLKHISYFSESSKFEAGEIHAVGRELSEFQERIDRSMISTKSYIDALEQLESKGTNLLYYNNAFYRPRPLTSSAYDHGV